MSALVVKNSSGPRKTSTRVHVGIQLYGAHANPVGRILFDWYWSLTDPTSSEKCLVPAYDLWDVIVDVTSLSAVSPESIRMQLLHFCESHNI